MIDDQLDTFPGHERFALAVLGLQSVCERFVHTLDVERSDGRICPDGPLVDFALGVVSLARTLRATLGTIPEPPPTDEGADREPGSHTSLLR